MKAAQQQHKRPEAVYGSRKERAAEPAYPPPAQQETAPRGQADIYNDKILQSTEFFEIGLIQIDSKTNIYYHRSNKLADVFTHRFAVIKTRLLFLPPALLF